MEKKIDDENDDFDGVYNAWLEDITHCSKEPDAIILTQNDFNNPAKHFSFADFMRIPESNRIIEMLNGIISLFATPPTVHAQITSALIFRLSTIMEQEKWKYHVYHNPFCVRLSPDGATDDDKIFNAVQPDICVICDSSKLDEIGCFGPPDLIVEVIYPKHRKHTVVEKFNLYEAAGVREYWIFDTIMKTVKVFLLQPDGKYDMGTVYDSNQKAPVHILEGLTIDLSEIFED